MNDIMPAFLCTYREPRVSTLFNCDLEDDFCYLNILKNFLG